MRRTLLRVTFYGGLFFVVFLFVASQQWSISTEHRQGVNDHQSEVAFAVRPDAPGLTSNSIATVTLRNVKERGDACQIQLPYQYPVHSKLPPAPILAQAVRAARNITASARAMCGTSSAPIFGVAPTLKVEKDAAALAALKKEFGFDTASESVFFSTLDDSRPKDQWWIYDDDRQLPCTHEVQQRLYDLQHPTDCKAAKFLVSKLKEGAHGVGSAITLVAHDLLSAIVLKRVLAVRASPRWFFASQHCAARSGLDCYFLPPTHCADAGHEEKVSSRSQAERSSSRFVRKSSFDIKGLGRNNVPSDEEFFGPEIVSGKCYKSFVAWTQDPRNTFLQGTFERGADPRLFFMLAQAVKYLMREPQPWFKAMLMHHLLKIGVQSAQTEQRLVYIQDRGEIAKYREYYNTFGCHTVRPQMLGDFALIIAQNWRRVSEKPVVFISGNTPYGVFLELERFLNHSATLVASTWRHPSLSTEESSRWGASSPAASWIDLYAGVASSSWVCIVQSNWCRMINFLRLTSSRATCSFVDVGIVMIADESARRSYCVVNPQWPIKPFSNVIHKHPLLPNLPVC